MGTTSHHSYPDAAVGPSSTNSIVPRGRSGAYFLDTASSTDGAERTRTPSTIVIAARPGARASAAGGALAGDGSADVGAGVGAAEGASDAEAASDADGLEVALIDTELGGFAAVPHEAMMKMQTVMARCSRIGNLGSTGNTALRSRR